MKKRWSLCFGIVLILGLAGCETLTDAGAGVKVYNSVSELPKDCQQKEKMRSSAMFGNIIYRIQNSAAKSGQNAIVITSGPNDVEGEGFFSDLLSEEYTADAYDCKE